MLAKLLRIVAASFAFCAVIGFVPADARAEEDPWSEIRQSLFASRKIVEDSSVKIFAPKRAEDAALVPVRVFIGAERVLNARRLFLVVDQNPAPVAAVFHFGDLYRTGGDVGDRSLEARVRLENMSRVRAVLETADGALYEASQFVAGAGGCTSSSLKDMDEAMRGLGKIRLMVEADPTRGNLWHEAQVQIRHPNFSGMQIDTKTNTYTPAEFVDRIEVAVGTEHLVTIESGIAISEDPNFRLAFAKQDPPALTLVARDTKSRKFRAQSQ
ncbi:quinoprotein dehydrogenase-associated SoxYZ-like carrier [Hyphomicrobium sp.]|uniref:quinoprotein dehydrogenase-associated SoxYZ-like carrier n=1 Tax=Hyphomicrobium sp. TaxID=82 RepID=UPI002E2F2E65|nr:quinoprotein dehydrogenase-associated SoxYZ-like carrier [Hyphomicrobium sp.]HEX2841859.1 quinoprotein dehydrogenase-associated SoxYZ-like carrier [Hyphomicrobium sp.]